MSRIDSIGLFSAESLTNLHCLSMNAEVTRRGKTAAGPLIGKEQKKEKCNGVGCVWRSRLRSQRQLKKRPWWPSRPEFTFFSKCVRARKLCRAPMADFSAHPDLLWPPWERMTRRQPAIRVVYPSHQLHAEGETGSTVKAPDTSRAPPLIHKC